MKSVFILHHSYEKDEYDETKFIGAYSSNTEAENAVKRLSLKNGFKDKIKGFSIIEYELNKDHWVEGFSTMAWVKVKAKTGEWITVSAECLDNDTYLLIEKYDNDKLGEFKDGDIVSCEEVSGKLYATKKINKSA